MMIQATGKTARTAADDPQSGKWTRILDAAQTLFWRYGVRRTSIDDIAAEAGVAKGTVYLYFDSKETLFEQLADRICGAVWTEINAALDMKAPLTARLARLMDAKIASFKRLLADSPHAAELIESQNLARAAFDGLTAGFDQAVLQVIREADAAGEIALGAHGLEPAAFAEMAKGAALGLVYAGTIQKEAFVPKLERHLALLVSALALA
jgi:AcrR family transcriptional regulator